MEEYISILSIKQIKKNNVKFATCTLFAASSISLVYCTLVICVVLQAQKQCFQVVLSLI